MRAPFLCTLTGADDSTHREDLFRLSAEFPFVEWGVLFHASKHGHERFPPCQWIESLCGQIPAHRDARFALHVCGREAVNDFLTGSDDMSRRTAPFWRVQLNLIATRHDPFLVIEAIRRNPGKIVITQHNEANEGLLPILSRIPNHAILFDLSGGQGASPESWPTHLPDKSCGYAGGLGPDNLARELPRIQEAAGKDPYWIDMEGKLRGDTDRFDLSRARLCLEACSQFVQSR